MAGAVQLRDLQTGRLFLCPVGDAVRVGRVHPESQVEIAFDDPYVSRLHAELRAQPDGGLEVLDLSSSSGTYVNADRVQGRAIARSGDAIQFGTGYRVIVLDRVGDATLVMPTEHARKGSPHQKTVVVPPPPPPQPARFSDGDLLDDRYQLVREIGRGGMGVVFQARDTREDRVCAVKILLVGEQSAPAERFEREAEVAALLGEHAQIVKVYDYGSVPDEGYLYLVMDYVDGPSLGHLARQGLPRRLGVELVAATARALAVAHAHQVLHRDVKPDNVLVTLDDHQVHLTDFGLAKVEGSVITSTGEVLGTPNYVAPEQLEDSKRATPQVDVYGLGGILYSVLTRRPPFEGRSVGDILRKVALGRLKPPEDHVPDLEPELSRICLRALSTDPARRPVSPDAFADELESWLGSGG